jgi:small subunit ribosomal protein S16
MKKMGKAHRAFFRICATDKRAPRDGRVLEELGTYDPSVSETDARARLDHERVAYWLGVGAQPSEKVAVLIKKYGPNGTHVDAQKQALERLAAPKTVPAAGPAVTPPKKVREAEAARKAEEAAAAAAADAKTESETAAAGLGEAESAAPPTPEKADGEETGS